MNRVRIVGAALSACMLLSLCACGGKADRPETAAELADRMVAAQTDGVNYRITGSVDMNVSMTSGVLNFTMPVSAVIEGAVMGEASYMKTVSSLTMGEGMDMESVSEEYREKVESGGVKVYSRTDDGAWSVSDLAGDDAVATGLSEDFFSSDLFANAEMVYEDGVYTVTLPMSELLSGTGVESDVLNFDDIMSSMGAEGDYEFNDVDVVYTVDDDYHLLGLSTSGFTCSSTATDADGNESSFDMDMSMEFSFSDYGAVAESDVAVPDDVKSDAESGTEGDTPVDITVPEF